jgi:acetate CoA/acetoacetate CoA-transferase alpha subunit
MGKVITLEKAVSLVKNGDVVMIGGFGAVGTPQRIVDALLEAGKKDLTVISNDSGWEDRGLGILVTAKCVKKLIVSHIGMNKQSGIQLNAGELEVELTPQGSLAERVRAGAYGLGGVLTPTGLGTAAQEGKRVINVDGKDYLLEKALRADVALLYAAKVDPNGNMAYKGAAVNFNHIMAGAAEITIVEAGELVNIGGIDPNQVITPGVFVDYVVGG